MRPPLFRAKTRRAAHATPRAVDISNSLLMARATFEDTRMVAPSTGVGSLLDAGRLFMSTMAAYARYRIMPLAGNGRLGQVMRIGNLAIGVHQVGRGGCFLCKRLVASMAGQALLVGYLAVAKLGGRTPRISMFLVNTCHVVGVMAGEAIVAERLVEGPECAIVRGRRTLSLVTCRAIAPNRPRCLCCRRGGAVSSRGSQGLRGARRQNSRHHPERHECHTDHGAKPCLRSLLCSHCYSLAVAQAGLHPGSPAAPTHPLRTTSRPKTQARRHCEQQGAQKRWPRKRFHRRCSSSRRSCRTRQPQRDDR